MPRSKHVISLVAVLALAITGGASAFVISHASTHIVQPQPASGRCHVRGHYPFNTRRWRTTSTRASATTEFRSLAHSASSRSIGCPSTKL